MKLVTAETPLEEVNKALAEAGKRMPADLFHRATKIRQIFASRLACHAYFDDEVRKQTALLIKELMQAIWDAKGDLRVKDAQAGGIAKAKKLVPLKNKLRSEWATGKYKSREICAEKNWEVIGLGSFKTARKALENTPNPNPWPAKRKV